MSIYLWVIGAYLVVLTGMNFWKSRQVRNKDDMMLAISLGSLILVSFFTKAPDTEVIKNFFPENTRERVS
ncbi:MAG: hypothetical protein KAH24_05335 [Holophagae bacterium]|nr:hypothetical protein [Holophagae bacterium]